MNSKNTRVATLFIVTMASAPIITHAQPGHQDSIRAESWNDVRNRKAGTLSIAFYEQPNFIHRDKDGMLNGLCVEILNDFASFLKSKYDISLQLKYERDEPVFSDFMTFVKNNANVLGVTNVTITDERRMEYKFTPPFMSNWVVMITNKNVSSIKREQLSHLGKLLAGFRAEVIRGSTFINYISTVKSIYLPDLEISYCDSTNEILSKIEQDPLLFTFLDITDFINAKKQHIGVKAHDLGMSPPEEFGFVMSKNSDWDEIWAEFMTPEYRNSTRYRKLLADFLGRTNLK